MWKSRQKLSRRHYVVLLAAALGIFWFLRTAHAGEEIFVLEQFVWQGDHAATIKGGTATTVWWNANVWDARADTANNAISSPGKGHHIDIHKSVADITSGLQDNTYAVGGDAGPGVGIMHVDFESIVSARLRNPMGISAATPGVVEFRAPSFVTSGHWWEVALTPTDIVRGAEFTAVPSPSDHFTGLPGPGHRPAEDSLNVILIGRNDVPCDTGWEARLGLTKALGGSTEDVSGSLIPIDPAEKDKLYAWRLEFYPDRVRALADLNEDGAKELLDEFLVSLPWDEAYVHLVSVAYQATKHPQDGNCGAWQGQMRELPWKEVRVSPLKYTRTSAYPKEQGADHIPQDTGWVGYDIRDTQRFGLPVVGPILGLLGIPQPNEAAYSKHGSMAFCHETGAGWFDCKGGPAAKQLTVDLPAADAKGITSAKLVYDVKEQGGATLRLNGVSVGSLPGAATVAASASDSAQWIQRSVAVDPALFRAGTNTINITMTGNIGFDRLQFEFGYGSSLPPPPVVPPPVVPPPAPGVLSWLHTEGSAVKNEAGKTVVLEGVNIERREFIWEFGPNLDYERAAVPVATGKPPAAWGSDVILIAVASGPINRGDAVYLGFLDEIVAMAKVNNAYTLLVYRTGEPNGDQPTMPDQAAQDALATLALRYANEPAVLYGLQVEPHNVSWSTLKPRFTSMIDAIRANNPKALIAVPGTQWGRYVYHQLSDPIVRENLVFKSHPYDTWATIQSAYRFEEMLAAGLPLFIGEFGVGSAMSFDDVTQLLDWAALADVSWTAWMFSDEACPCLLTDRTTFAATAYGAEVQSRLQGIGIGLPPGLTGDIWGPNAKPSDALGKRGDGKVDIYDVSRLFTLWGKTDATSLAEGDTNAGPKNVSAGAIDLYDANLMMKNWTG